MNWDLLLSFGLWIYSAFVIALSLRILTKRRPVGATLAWLLLIYVLPVLGISFYLLFGERYLGRIRAARALTQYRDFMYWINRDKSREFQQVDNELTNILHPSMILTQINIGMPILANQSWSLIDKSERLFKKLTEDIQQAQHCIFFEFYILEAQGTVLELLTTLEQAAARGVHVYLMLDSVGSNNFLHSKRCQQLQKNNVKVLDVLHANFLRMTLRRQDLRQHRKLIAIDNRIAYTGSMNLVDPRFFKTKSGIGPWVDLMVRLEGNMAKILQGTLVFDWEMETGTRLEKHLDWPATNEPHEKPLMQLLPTGPAIDEELLLQVLLTSIHNAKKQIFLTTPYFVPDESLLQALKSAAKQGLSVTIMVPRRNDSKLAQFAGRSFYDELLTAGVNIWRFTGGLLHTKTVIIDDHLVLMGSVNLDMRSLWLNFEATLIVDDQKFCLEVLDVIHGYANQSQQINLMDWRKRPYFKKILESIAQLASPLL